MKEAVHKENRLRAIVRYVKRLFSRTPDSQTKKVTPTAPRPALRIQKGPCIPTAPRHALRILKGPCIPKKLHDVMTSDERKAILTIPSVFTGQPYWMLRWDGYWSWGYDDDEVHLIWSLRYGEWVRGHDIGDATAYLLSK